MKKLRIFCFLPLLLLFLSCGNSGNKNSTNDVTADANTPQNSNAPGAANKKYGIKSGIVVFETDGMGIKSKVVLYFDDFGAKEAEEKYDLDNNITTSELCDGTNRYTLVYKDKAAYKSGECQRGVAYRFDWDGVSRAAQNYNAKKLPNVSIAGKDSEAFSLESSGNTITYAGWNNVCLLIDQNTQFGPVSYKAISFEENPEIPEGKLSVPAGFEVKQPGV
jgi:hypothetical protein